MFRGSKRRAGRPGGRASARGRNGASMSSPSTGTASRSITSSATRTGAPATAASARPYLALTVNGWVPVAVASPTRAVTVSQRSSGTSSPAGSMSTALTTVPAVRSSRAAVSSRPLATSASAAGRPSRLSSSLSPKTRSHSGAARWPASSASTMRRWCSRQSGTSLPSGARAGRLWCVRTMRTVVTAALQQTAGQRFGSHSLVSDGPPPVTRLPPGRVRNGRRNTAPGAATRASARGGNEPAYRREERTTISPADEASPVTVAAARDSYCEERVPVAVVDGGSEPVHGGVCGFPESHGFSCMVLWANGQRSPMPTWRMMPAPVKLRAAVVSHSSGVARVQRTLPA